MEFVLVTAIMLFVLHYNRSIDTKKFFNDIEPYFQFLMEDDYKFLLEVKYGDSKNYATEFNKRITQALVLIVVLVFVFLMSNLNFVNILLAFILGFLAFKAPYMQLSSYYKANLHTINQMLPYYLKSLEILVQHYTVPVAMRRSIPQAPKIFVSGLKRLVEKIEAGDASVDPYMDFAKEYPVRDSMRMMRLLYRLGLGSQENKQEQLLMFSRTVSSLQNKAREQKYKERLEKMENMTMMMLCVTGGGILLLLLYAMMSMMNI
ncbi:MAG: hypothetical protein PHN72_00415 [Bacilli bacterium]|nr:hypothetical protein [Bacilli bacterium]